MIQVDRQLAALVRPRSPVAMEIHTHLVGTDSPIRFDIDLIWNGSRPVEVSGVMARSLSPEPLLASLAINFLKDRRLYSYSAVGQLCDVSEVLRAYETAMDGDQFGVAGQSANFRGVTFGTLSLRISYWMLQFHSPFSRNLRLMVSGVRLAGTC